MTHRLGLRQAVAAILAAIIGAHSAPARAVDEAAERLAQQRRDADARYLGAVATCSAQFAVNDCVERAKAEHRKLIEQTRREQQALDDARRRARAEQRARAVDAKASDAIARAPKSPASAASASAKPPTAPEAASKAARTASRSSVASTPPRASSPSITPKTVIPDGAEQAERRRQRASQAEQRRLKAEAHREEVERRNAEHDRKRPPSASLPAPTAASAAMRQP